MSSDIRETANKRGVNMGSIGRLKVITAVYSHPIYFSFNHNSLFSQFSNDLFHVFTSDHTLESPFFDYMYYLFSSPDVEQSSIDPVFHYLNYGWRELRSPSPYFNASNFSQAHPEFEGPTFDLAEVCLRLYGSFAWEADAEIVSVQSSNRLHFTPFTRHERTILFKKWRTYQSLFDADFYIQEYPEVASTPMSAFAHYMHRGFSEDRQPRPDFDGYRYRKSNGLRRGQNPFRHYIDKFSAYDRISFTADKRYSLSWDLKDFEQNLSVCIHVHCFYLDLLEEFVELLRHIRIRYSLVVTVSSADAALAAGKTVEALQDVETHILVVENRGRDIGPFLMEASKVWHSYDIVLHLHTKRSPHISWGDNWRRYLLKQTIGSNTTLEKIIDLFDKNPRVGLVYAENYCMIRHFTEREENRAGIEVLAKKLDLNLHSEIGSTYPAGSMAFYRVKALLGLANHKVLRDLFEKEDGQLDGTAAHALERLLPEVVRQQGYDSKIYVSD